MRKLLKEEEIHPDSKIHPDSADVLLPVQRLMNCRTDRTLTAEHRHAVDHAVDPGSGGVILLKVQLELHKENGKTSGQRTKGGGGREVQGGATGTLSTYLHVKHSLIQFT